jgi:tRNA pseudouridine38-40 synthase
MPTYRLTLEYEGTRYRGWQEQKNARTVGGEVRRALEAALGQRVDLAGSGRTDAGVHALAQVAHVKTAAKLRCEEIRLKVEESLPADIHLLAFEPAEERFHARHSASARSYVYQISRRRTALAKRFVWWVRRPLEVERMRAAAARIAGRHDFAAFCEKPEEQTSTIVVVERCEVASDGELVLVPVVASHFLWKMVRRLVGALVEVGAGELAEADFAALFATRRDGAPLVPNVYVPVKEPGRARDAPPRFEPLAKVAAKAARTDPARFDPAANTAPPSGLFLERVIYPGEPLPGPLVAVTPVR